MEWVVRGGVGLTSLAHGAEPVVQVQTTTARAVSGSGIATTGGAPLRSCSARQGDSPMPPDAASVYTFVLGLATSAPSSTRRGNASDSLRLTARES